jgi:hypothetical protein
MTDIVVALIAVALVAACVAYTWRLDLGDARPSSAPVRLPPNPDHEESAR